MRAQDPQLGNTANATKVNEHLSRESQESRKDAAVTRREFLELAIATTLVAGVGQSSWAGETKGGMPYRTLGRTGEKVSLVGQGGYHLGKQANEQESIHIIRTAIDNGVNFMDNCWDYNDGVSEVRMGKALRDGYRQRVLLMTKIDSRDRKTAAAQIDESLRRLQTDRIDLLQFHEAIRLSDPERIFGPNGALEAVLDAKKAGKVRYIGFTGHKSPAIHSPSLKPVHAFTSSERTDRAVAGVFPFALSLAKGDHEWIAIK